MIERAHDILLLAEPAVADELAPALAAQAEMHSDPFAAMEALHERRHRAVVVAAGQPRLGRLIQAMRRIQPAAHVFGLCDPGQEPDVRRLSEGLLEDYFILPPTRGEWRRIGWLAQGRSAEAGAVPGEASDVPTSALSSRQVADLITAASSISELARTVAALAGRALGVSAHWAPADKRPAGGQRLATLETDPPRVLWASEPLPDRPELNAWLAQLRGLLPALAQQAAQADTLRRLATTDDLTGARNRRYFMHFGRQLLQRARRQQFRVTLLSYDLDDFKRYNDLYGHAAGDEILRETAGLMKQITRRHDVIARIGGDEFAVLIWDMGPTRQPGSRPPRSSSDLADRFCRAVNSHQFKSLGPDAQGTLTISGGLASFPWDGLTIEELLAQADKALLNAKALGKNNIYLTGTESGR